MFLQRLFTPGPSKNLLGGARLAYWSALLPTAICASLACTSPTTSNSPPVSPAPAPADADSSGASGSSTETAPAGDPKPARASVFVIHQVPDFDVYLRQFGGNADARTKAGVTRVILTRLVDDPTRVGLHFSAGSLDSIRAFLASNDYERLAQADKATDSTILWIATDELDELPSVAPPGTASLFKKFPLRDVDCALTGLRSSQAQLRGQGLLGFSVHRTESDASVAILHLVATDAAKADQLYANGPISNLLKGCGGERLEKPVIGVNQELP